MGAIKPKAKAKPKSKTSGVVGAAKGLFGIGGKSKSGTRRKHGATYWANKVLVEKLKRRYNKLKYGGVR